MTRRSSPMQAILMPPKPLVVLLLSMVVLSCFIRSAISAATTTNFPLDQASHRFTEEDPEPNSMENLYAEGCYVCADYRCPPNPQECLLGTVPDTCGCCSQGTCARLDGESCWNASIPQLPPMRRNEGLCARNYVCTLRNDLEPEDVPEATCVCMEQTPACGSNNRTYPSPCALHEEVARRGGSEQSGLRLLHLGPCPSRPIIYSALENVEGVQGQSVALSCEAKGFPLPEIFWEFHSANGGKILRLPNEELEDGDVDSSGGSDALIRTSWLQIYHLEKHHVGTYFCIATNSMGGASTASNISIM
ncbi:hypothetical protein QAD02_019931 [Eretmocerus hayati]|uniref:Uncharacterized protein n=1 Tax=Eretmocerus hayati TaxID=131215 RepID=A0ACC2PNH7_9HYME|nr:hypothetical protein QAD02_019931 [Eretmocerus hayati]